jgi:hypothetical protein
MKRIFFALAGVITAGTCIATTEPETSPPPTEPASSAAQHLYATAQGDLLQLRVLLKNGDSQSSVGSGFFIGNSRLVVTNFHVVSQIALEPETYLGQYKDTQGKSGSIELLAVDVLHDLAVVRVEHQGSGFFQVPAMGQKLAKLDQGERLYSLGNPLDLGFTITEGTYNGISSRGFSDQLMFTGPVNPGMSGGPNITADGQLAGVNVAHRRDGELVSFLVPGHFVQELLARVSEDMTAPEDFKPIIGEQLLQHQAIMVDKLLEKPFSVKQLGPYQVPVRESEQVRCWGDSNTNPKRYSTASIHCSMESEIFVSGDLQTGNITITHKYLHNKKLNALQFSHLVSNEFSGQVYSTANSDNITPAACNEQFVRTNHLPLRALVCAEAYHQFAGLYDFTLITASTDDNQKNLQSMINVLGVSYENGTRLVRHFLESMDRLPAKETKPTDVTDPEKNLEEPAIETIPAGNPETASETATPAAEATP